MNIFVILFFIMFIVCFMYLFYKLAVITDDIECLYDNYSNVIENMLKSNSKKKESIKKND